MIKEIPVPKGQRIVGYEEAMRPNGDLYYKPIYRSKYISGNVYKDGSKMYVYSEERFFNVLGIEEEPKYLEEVTPKEIESFFEQLKNNGEILDRHNKLVRGYWFPEYNHNCGFYPCFTTDTSATYALEPNKKFNEAYPYRAACVERCNYINKLLNRGYAEQV